METPVRGLDLDLERLSGQKEGIFTRCKDFLCPGENRFREWFPTFIKARTRAKALDPFGFMKEKMKNMMSSDLNKDEISVYYKCQGEQCHATLVLRKVRPDSQGNTYGLYGCLTHQHPITRDKRSEIIFRNKTEAQEFYDTHLKHMYKTTISRKNSYRHFKCRRKGLKELGHHPCESTVSFHPTFSGRSLDNWTKSEIQALSEDEIPYSIFGLFYHTHENDEKFNRDEVGGWKVHSAKALKYSEKKRLRDRKPRFNRGKVYPLSARMAGITKEDIMKARVQDFGGKGNKKYKAKINKEKA